MLVIDSQNIFDVIINHNIAFVNTNSMIIKKSYFTLIIILVTMTFIRRGLVVVIGIYGFNSVNDNIMI